MEDRLNRLVRKFYLGDNRALDELSLLLRELMCRRLKAKFWELNLADIQDIVADWFTDFFIRVSAAREVAVVEGQLRNLSPEETDELKIFYCSAKPNFDFRGTPFDAWLWQVLKHNTLDMIRKNGRLQSKQVDLDKLDAPGRQPYQQGRHDQIHEAKELEDLAVAQLDGEKPFPEMSDAEIARLMQKIEDNLKSVLDDDELLYFRVWRKHEGCDPSAKAVREAFPEERRGELTDVYISRLKQRFLRYSYLVFLENLSDAKYMSNLFWRLVKGKEDEKTFYPPMMERIWRVFEEDAEVVHESQRRISPRLWRELNASSEQNGGHGRIKRLRSQILVAAYHYYRMRNMSPRFCKLVDLYSEDRFGGEIRRLFWGGGANN